MRNINHPCYAKIPASQPGKRLAFAQGWETASKGGDKLDCIYLPGLVKGKPTSPKYIAWQAGLSAYRESSYYSYPLVNIYHSLDTTQDFQIEQAILNAKSVDYEDGIVKYMLDNPLVASVVVTVDTGHSHFYNVYKTSFGYLYQDTYYGNLLVYNKTI